MFRKAYFWPFFGAKKGLFFSPFLMTKKWQKNDRFSDLFFGPKKYPFFDGFWPFLSISRIFGVQKSDSTPKNLKIGKTPIFHWAYQGQKPQKAGNHAITHGKLGFRLSILS